MKNLNISSRLILVLILTGMFFLSLISYLYLVSSKQEKLIFNDSRLQFSNEVNSLLTLKITSLKQVTNDYTFWDDFVKNIDNKDSVWLTNNITTIIKSFHVEYVCVYDTSFNIIHQVATDGFISRNFISGQALEQLKVVGFRSLFIGGSPGMDEQNSLFFPNNFTGHLKKIN